MGFYSRVIFPALYDFIVDRRCWTKHRQKQLADVEGEILEIGAGTGLNLPYYPKHVRKITTVDPNPGMNKRLQRRSNETGIEVSRHALRCEQLPFEEGTFDCAVSTLTLCSIAGVEQALSEVLRVLKPGGRFLFFEHGLSPEPDVARWQRRLNWLQRLFADGCRLDLDVRKLLAGQPFESVEIDTFYLEKAPKSYGHVFRGVAVK